jgi:hypothetical protein
VNITDNHLIKAPPPASPTSNSSARVYQPLVPASALQSIFFIIALDAISKSTNNKYANATLSEVGVNTDTQNVLYYQVEYVQGSNRCEIVASINKNTFGTTV